MSVYDEKPSPGAGLQRYARLKAGLSQSELAKRAGVPTTMVSTLPPLAGSAVSERSRTMST